MVLQSHPKLYIHEYISVPLNYASMPPEIHYFNYYSTKTYSGISKGRETLLITILFQTSLYCYGITLISMFTLKILMGFL